MRSIAPKDLNKHSMYIAIFIQPIVDYISFSSSILSYSTHMTRVMSPRSIKISSANAGTMLQIIRYRASSWGEMSKYEANVRPFHRSSYTEIGVAKPCLNNSLVYSSSVVGEISFSSILECRARDAFGYDPVLTPVLVFSLNLGNGKLNVLVT